MVAGSVRFDAARGALLVWLAAAALYAAERAVRERLGATIGWGVAIAIGVPLLAILALVTLVGIPFGVALLLAGIPVLLVAYATTAWIVGRRVLRGRSASPWGRCWPAGGSCACWPSSPSLARLSGSRRRSWDSEPWPSRYGGPRQTGAPVAKPESPPRGPPASRLTCETACRGRRRCSATMLAPCCWREAGGGLRTPRVLHGEPGRLGGPGALHAGAASSVPLTRAGGRGYRRR